MPSKSESSQSSLAVILEKMSEKPYSFNFDVTLELATRSMRLGTVRVYGRIEAMAGKKK